MIGRIVGNYKIEKKLGEGGMGTVYKGVDTMLDREVAIKVLRPELVSQTAVVERFRSEAVTLAKLQHPNIATLYSLFRQSDELYMVLEFVRGETLDSILQRRGALPAEEVIPVFCQILDGINHAHEFGVIHRDIKPANMMLTEKGNLKVLDFGIARLLGSNRMTRAGNIIGTLEYMSPEQIRGQETDARSDLYALGMLLYEMLTGRAAFESDNEFELMKSQTERMPTSPRLLKPDIPEEVGAAIVKSIQKDPNARFQTAAEFRETLLDAGFAAHGSIRRSTGPRRRADSGSKSVADSTSDIQNPEQIRLSETKEAEVVSTAPRPIKETQFVPTAFSFGGSGEENYFEVDEPSFFSRFTPAHYIGAGVAGVMFLGLLIILPLILFGGGDDAPKNTTMTSGNTSNANVISKTPVPQPSRSEIVRQPVAETPVRPVSTPIPVTPVETVSEATNANLANETVARNEASKRNGRNTGKQTGSTRNNNGGGGKGSGRNNGGGERAVNDTPPPPVTDPAAEARRREKLKRALRDQ